MRTEERAPAKINLALHVTSRRPDGYHLIDSLVVFTAMGDTLSAEPAEDLRLELGGAFGGALAATPDNLVLRAARLMGAEAPGQGVALRLEKRLPVASGIGGGSADAAATLRALARMRKLPLPEPAAVLGLGADVPACLLSRPLRMGGIGERLEPLAALPPFRLVLVNPGVAVSTAEVFAGLERSGNSPLPPMPARWPGAAGFARWLGGLRNDLEAPARAIAPAIGAALAALSADADCLLARMSGSGATCFGLFPGPEAAVRAAGLIARARPEWWVCETGLAPLPEARPAD